MIFTHDDSVLIAGIAFGFSLGNLFQCLLRDLTKKRKKS